MGCLSASKRVVLVSFLVVAEDATDPREGVAAPEAVVDAEAVEEADEDAEEAEELAVVLGVDGAAEEEAGGLVGVACTALLDAEAEEEEETEGCERLRDSEVAEVVTGVADGEWSLSSPAPPNPPPPPVPVRSSELVVVDGGVELSGSRALVLPCHEEVDGEWWRPLTSLCASGSAEPGVASAPSPLLPP